MTMTPERLAELDAVMAKATAGEWEIYGEPEVGLPPSLFSCETTTWPSRTPLEPLCRDDEAAIVALHNAYPELKALIDAQAATIARLREALDSIAVYGDDTLSGPVSEAAYRHWHRDGVRVMRDRARAALTANHSAPVEEE